MRLQINMNCVECDDVLPVRVKADDTFVKRTAKKPVSKMDFSDIYEQIPCPACGEDNLWDRVNRNFV